MFNNKKSVELTQVFNYGEVEGTPIRVQVTNNEPWFVATDVCQVWGISNNRDAVSRLDDDERMDGVGITDTVGRKNYGTIINESGLYSLIFQSRKPEAKKFRKWVTMEVLPSIRKTGKYEKKPKVALIPRGKSSEMAEFHDELTQWVTLDDEKSVAELMNVSRRHVHKVLRGFSQSYGVLCMLVEFGKDNRQKGVKRVVVNRPRKEDMEQLRLEFMEG